MNRSSTFLSAVLLAASLVACRERPQGPLFSPDPQALKQAAPDSFRVEFTTNKGAFVVQAVRAWSPNGVDRFYYLTRNHYYDDVRFFRAVQGFMVQFGLNVDPRLNDVWGDMRIPDDGVIQSNKKGFVTFAMGGPNTRSTQLFINLVDNQRLDAMGFSPIGRLVQGMEIVEALYTGYGDAPPGGRGPEQERIRKEGNTYLTRDFPQLDYITSTKVMEH